MPSHHLTIGLLSFASACLSFSVPLRPPVYAQDDGYRPLAGTAPNGPMDLSQTIAALEVMQQNYFQVWLGTWPGAIDWTAAVLGHHIPASLTTVSKINASQLAGRDPEDAEHSREDLINRYFDQLITFYFGQDWFSLRTQANDDMLWVVLGWLEAVTFVQGHSQRRHGDCLIQWHGEQFVEPFGHRARVFWELADQGWDETLCGGGMIWNPRLAPYKNAITNELYIAASIRMYLDFPGDDNESPFLQTSSEESKHKFEAHDLKYLDAAVKGYKWLKESNMTNSQGLYVDGFHIKGWRGGKDGSPGTGKCDERDETVYTYNQGVILTGQRGLWQAIGDDVYLEDGHQLIRNVIAATGWDLWAGKPESMPEWQGLGRLGVLEDQCDILGSCSQDAQMFKGIFFLHLSAFCQPLPQEGSNSYGYKASKILAKEHYTMCNQYISWIQHNADAASMTRDENGLFGQWWTERIWSFPTSPSCREEYAGPVVGTDYRNKGVPDDEIWRLEPGSSSDWHMKPISPAASPLTWQLPLELRSPEYAYRSVEIQSGGLSVMRAAVEHSPSRDVNDLAQEL